MFPSSQCTIRALLANTHNEAFFFFFFLILSLPVFLLELHPSSPFPLPFSVSHDSLLIHLLLLLLVPLCTTTLYHCHHFLPLSHCFLFFTTVSFPFALSLRFVSTLIHLSCPQKETKESFYPSESTDNSHLPKMSAHTRSQSQEVSSRRPKVHALSVHSTAHTLWKEQKKTLCSE